MRCHGSNEMTKTHEKEQIKKLLMICGLTLEAIKNLAVKFDELSEWQQAALPENYKLAHTALLALGLSLANLLIELGVAERVSEDAK